MEDSAVQEQTRITMRAVVEQKYGLYGVSINELFIPIKQEQQSIAESLIGKEIRYEIEHTYKLDNTYTYITIKNIYLT